MNALTVRGINPDALDGGLIGEAEAREAIEALYNKANPDAADKVNQLYSALRYGQYGEQGDTAYTAAAAEQLSLMRHGYKMKDAALEFWRGGLEVTDAYTAAALMIGGTR